MTQDEVDRLVPTGDEMLTAVRKLVSVAGEIGLTVDNLPSWRRRIGARNDLCAAGCRDLSIDPAGRVHACVITAGDPAFVAGSLRERPLAEIWRESGSLRLLRAARARDRAECLACPVADACGGECWVQAHYAARARGERAGYAAPFPYCDLVRPLLEELAAEAEAAAPAGDDCVAGAAASPRPAPATTPSSTASEDTDGAGVTRARRPSESAEVPCARRGLGSRGRQYQSAKGSACSGTRASPRGNQASSSPPGGAARAALRQAIPRRTASHAARPTGRQRSCGTGSPSSSSGYVTGSPAAAQPASLTTSAASPSGTTVLTSTGAAACSRSSGP